MYDPKVCWTAARVVRNERWMEREYEEDISNNKPARGTKERKKASKSAEKQRKAGRTLWTRQVHATARRVPLRKCIKNASIPAHLNPCRFEGRPEMGTSP